MFNEKKKPEINFQKEYFFILLVHKSHLLYEGEFVLFIMMRFQIKNKKKRFFPVHLKCYFITLYRCFTIANWCKFHRGRGWHVKVIGTPFVQVSRRNYTRPGSPCISLFSFLLLSFITFLHQYMIILTPLSISERFLFTGYIKMSPINKPHAKRARR